MNDSTFQPPETGNKPPFWLIGLLAIIVLAFIGGSIFLYYTLILQPQQRADPHYQATATAKGATSLLQMSPNQLYTYLKTQHPSFTDTLDGQNRAAWDLSTGCIFKNNALHITVSLQTIFTACYLHNRFAGNFALQVQMQMKPVKTPEQTSAGGILFRSDLTRQTGYIFEVITHTNGTLTDTQASLTFNDANAQPHPLLSQTNPTLNDLNQAKELTVIALQNKIYTYINGKLMGVSTDTSAYNGAIGLCAVNGGPDPLIDVAFQNARLWTLS